MMKYVLAAVLAVAMVPAQAGFFGGNTTNNYDHSVTAEGGKGGRGGNGGEGGTATQGQIAKGGSAKQHQDQSQVGIVSGYQKQSASNEGVELKVEGDVTTTYYEEAHLAPSVQTMSTAPCIVGIGGSVGVGSIFSAGGSGGYKDEECSDLEAIRVGLSLGDQEMKDESKALMMELLKDRMARRQAARDTSPYVSVEAGARN